MTLGNTANITKPGQALCFEILKQKATGGALQNDLVFYLFPPEDAANTAEASHVKTVIFVLASRQSVHYNSFLLLMTKEEKHYNEQKNNQLVTVDPFCCVKRKQHCLHFEFQDVPSICSDA